MDQSSIYGLDNLSGFQPGAGGIGVDAPMSGGQVPPEFSSMPMSIGGNNFEGGHGDVYAPLNMDLPNFAPQGVNIPSGGAGHSSLPADPPMQHTGPARSVLGEFTRRRDLPQRIVEELNDFLHILTSDGRIVYLSPSSESLTGYPLEELRGKFIIDFIHSDDSGLFMREFNESIASESPLHLFYRFRRQDGSYTIFECRGHPHFASEPAEFDPSSSVRVCGGYFMSAFPYPSKNSALLDSFLEHKLENERLTKRINDLKREEAEDEKEEQKEWQRKQGRRSSLPFEETGAGGRFQPVLPLSQPVPLTAPGNRTMLPLTRPSPVNSRHGGAENNLTGNPVRHDGATHVDTIELLTGLNYQGGERSQGLSTGDQSPMLVRGDAGIAMPLNREPKPTDKKKKAKLPEEYVCTDCGTLDSPEWRKGPSGPKTLCNACGLRWAKKEKRKSFSAPMPLMVFSGSK